MYIVLDFETTGIFDGGNPQRAIQLAWLCMTNEYKIITTKSMYISGHNEINVDFHKNLTCDFINTYGNDLSFVISSLLDDLQRVMHHDGVIVAHNIEFDFKVLVNEIQKANLTNQLTEDIINYFGNPVHQYCTMKNSTELCRLPRNMVNSTSTKKQVMGYKYPKLIELFQFLFNKDPKIPLHDAWNDVHVTTECLIKLIQLSL